MYKTNLYRTRGRSLGCSAMLPQPPSLLRHCAHTASHMGATTGPVSLCSVDAASVQDRGRCLSHARLSLLAVNRALSMWCRAPTRGTSCQAAASRALRRKWSCRPLALLFSVEWLRDASCCPFSSSLTCAPLRLLGTGRWDRAMPKPNPQCLVVFNAIIRARC